MKGPIRGGRWDVTYQAVPAPGEGLWRFQLVWRPAAGGQTVLAEFDWRPSATPPDAGFTPDSIEATLDLQQLNGVAGDVVALQVLWEESGVAADATVIEAFPSMEIPGYVQ